MNKRTILAVLLIGGWLPAVALLSALQGCEAGTTGLVRPIAPQIAQTISNVVPAISAGAAQVAPAPFNGAIQIASAAVMALLAAWQGWSHSRISRIQSSSANTSTAPQT